MKYKYQGKNSSMRVAGIMFIKGAETEITADQDKVLKADRFGKAFLDNGTLVETKTDADTAPDTKPVDKMTVKELEAYITDNGGEFADDDNKPELLAIAQSIEDGK
ncbi:MAG: hypothetical protein ACTH7L_14440 [Psychrobacter alimentarius]